MTLSVMEYTLKSTVQRYDFCLEVGIYAVLSFMEGLKSRNGAVWHLMGAPHFSVVNLFSRGRERTKEHI